MANGTKKQFPIIKEGNMDYTFEKVFSEIQSNMVAACIGYVKNNAEKIFIHLSHERRMYSYGFFFQILGGVEAKYV